MAINEAYIAELKYESIATRKMLELVPMDKYDWKPHEKSMSLGPLAQHIVNLVHWAEVTAGKDEMDLAIAQSPAKLETNKALIDAYNANLGRALAALEGVSDEQMRAPWTLRHGEHVIFTLPRVQVLRNACYNHLVHHRGQLSVYLRMLNVPLPGVYGPSADEK